MSTCCNVHFGDSGSDALRDFNVYIHHDGYPEGVGRDLFEFLRDTNGGSLDAGRTCSMFIVWKALRVAKTMSGGRYTQTVLDNVTAELCEQDHGDIEFRYLVDSYQPQDPDGWPVVSCTSVYRDAKGNRKWRAVPLDEIRKAVLEGEG